MKETLEWDLSWAQQGIHDLAVAWRDSPARPRVADEVLDHWDPLIEWWVTNPDLPLPSRSKAAGRRGCVVTVAGRDVVLVDNSPPQWIFARAVDGWTPSEDELADAIVNEMPVAMILPVQERSVAKYTSTLGKVPSTSVLGLKLHHIDGVATKKAPEKASIGELQDAARRLLTPRNMFVLPKAISGLGEVPVFIEVMAGSGREDA